MLLFFTLRVVNLTRENPWVVIVWFRFLFLGYAMSLQRAV